jgi:hypothetical protein
MRFHTYDGMTIACLLVVYSHTYSSRCPSWALNITEPDQNPQDFHLPSMDARGCAQPIAIRGA